MSIPICTSECLELLIILNKHTGKNFYQSFLSLLANGHSYFWEGVKVRSCLRCSNMTWLNRTEVKTRTLRHNQKRAIFCQNIAVCLYLSASTHKSPHSRTFNDGSTRKAFNSTSLLVHIYSFVSRSNVASLTSGDDVSVRDVRQAVPYLGHSTVVYFPSLSNTVFNYGDGQDVYDTLVLAIDGVSGSILVLPSAYG